MSTFAVGVTKVISVGLHLDGPLSFRAALGKEERIESMAESDSSWRVCPHSSGWHRCSSVLRGAGGGPVLLFVFTLCIEMKVFRDDGFAPRLL